MASGSRAGGQDVVGGDFGLSCGSRQFSSMTVGGKAEDFVWGEDWEHSPSAGNWKLLALERDRLGALPSSSSPGPRAGLFLGLNTSFA